MLNKLPPRERQIVDLLYQHHGGLLVAEICDSLPDQPSGSAVRTMLKRLEDKGYVQRTESEKGFLYSPAVSDAVARKTALSDVVRVFFNNSPAGAATALLGMSGLDSSELDEIEAMIAKARAAKNGKGAK
jgi:BlaI family transcriptional regulator, penicillinase repressor